MRLSFPGGHCFDSFFFADMGVYASSFVGGVKLAKKVNSFLTRFYLQMYLPDKMHFVQTIQIQDTCCILIYIFSLSLSSSVSLSLSISIYLSLFIYLSISFSLTYIFFSHLYARNNIYTYKYVEIYL